MPCRDDRDNCGSDTVRIGRLQERLDEVTQNLCYLCGTAEKNALHILKGNKRLAKWWEDHQKADTKRVKEQMLEHIKQYRPMDSASVANDFILVAKHEHPVSEFHEEWFHRIAAEVMTKYAAEYKAKQDMVTSIKSKLSAEELLHIQTNVI